MAATDFVFIIKTRRAVVQESKESILKYKLAYSGIILFVYVIGKNIPLYALDISAYREAYFNVEELLLQSIGGDAYRSSVFALGIFPSMISGFLVQIFMAVRGLFTKSVISPGKSRRMTVAVTLAIALFQAFTRVREIKFIASAQEMPIVQAIAAARQEQQIWGQRKDGIHNCEYPGADYGCTV